MKKIVTFCLLIVMQIVSAQEYDSKRISKLTVVDLLKSEFVGFEDYGIIYYVEKDLKTMVAVEKTTKKVKWKTNVILACGSSSEGKPEIRYLKLHKGNIHIIYGKHNEAELEASDGSLFLCGSD